jgi:uncharacterized membrane protein YqhA
MHAYSATARQPMNRRTVMKRLEYRFEEMIWRLRLMAMLPVVMSLASSLMTFVLGTLEVGQALLQISSYGGSDKKFIAGLLGDVVTGIDLYLIGIALMIFGYGIYELLISPIEAAREADQGGLGLLDIRNLDQLKEKLVKVLVVALIVAAFKAMLTLPINDGASLAFFCLSVLLLAVSGSLVTNDAIKLPRKS